MSSQDPISKRIKEMRLQRGLSQAQLAHPELSDSYISLIESGSRKPTPAVLELLASKLGCSVSYLLHGVTAEELEDLELNLRYARLALDNGEVMEARRRYAELLDNPNISQLPTHRQEAEYGMALATEACGDLDEAIAILRRIQDTAGDSLTRERRIAIAIALCRCYRQRGDLTMAVDVAEETMSAMSEQGWTDDLVELGATLLSAYLERGDLLRAHHFSSQLMEAAEKLGSPRAIVAASWNAATAADLSGRGEEAVPLAERALAVQSETGEPRNLARLRVDYAFIRLRTRPHEAAVCREILLRAERELGESAASTVDLADCLLHLAHAEITLGRAEEAVDYATRALSLLDDTTPDLRADVHLMRGHAYLLLQRRTEALTEINEAEKLLNRLPSSRITAENWMAAAALLEELAEPERSILAYQRAMECGGL
ncbi:helix-turn-helix domain-containing protein [Thermopolyspora flexuosa]|uniref:Tetratricopeptide repeat protein n=1 Tax=Thermopolyspora flexuosa TaxID=103836 RepID=A0A543IWE1_9ACTN|nr:helix-turn-helix transcriptional regulator [Thermopolyspora flexuosa]TQM74896.1 tetratricopeptide repeat protein [Thermopolyspora flexuosa]